VRGRRARLWVGQFSASTRRFANGNHLFLALGDLKPDDGPLQTPLQPPGQDPPATDLDGIPRQAIPMCRSKVGAAATVPVLDIRTRRHEKGQDRETGDHDLFVFRGP